MIPTGWEPRAENRRRGQQYCVTNTPAASCAFAWKKLPAKNDAWPNWVMKMPPENPPTERKPASNGNMIYTGERPERVEAV